MCDSPLNFPTRGSDCDSHSPYFLYLVLYSDFSICSAMAFPPLENSNHVVASVSIQFLSNKIGDVPFQCRAYEYSRAD